MNFRIKVHWSLRCMAAIVYACLIYAISSEDTSSVPLPLFIDKIIHFIVFGLLCSLVCWALSPARIGMKNIYKIIIAIIITSLYAATDEFHQYFTPNRTVDFRDWLADTTGAIVTGFLWQKMNYMRERNGRTK